MPYSQVQSLEESRSKSDRAASELDVQVVRLSEEKLGLRAELAERKSESETLRGELRTERERLEQLGAERRQDAERIRAEAEKNHKVGRRGTT